MKKKASIITKMEDFLLYSIPILTEFPQKHKYLLADKIERNLLHILDLLIEAYYKAKLSKIEILKTINIELEKTRHIIKLCYNLKVIHFKVYENISFKLDEIGKMNGAWLKSLS